MSSSPYDPSAYSSTPTSSVSGQVGRDWSFQDFEDEPVAYLVVKGGDRVGGKNIGNSKAKSDLILQNILRCEGLYNPHSCAHNPRPPADWVIAARFGSSVSLLGREVLRDGVEGRNGSWHEKVREHRGGEKEKKGPREGVELDGDYLFAETMGYKHRRTYDQWLAKKESEMAAQNSKKKSSRKSEAEDEKKRKEECERVYNEWMRKRGGRKMEIVGRREEGEDERVEEKGRRGEEMKRKPWREKVVHAENVMEARRARREEEEKRKVVQEMEREEREGRGKVIEGVFLEWLTEKEKVGRKERRETREREREEIKRKEGERRRKWKKGIVGGCHYHGEAMNALRDRERRGELDDDL